MPVLFRVIVLYLVGRMPHLPSLMLNFTNRYEYNLLAGRFLSLDLTGKHGVTLVISQ